ncbi:MAG TPA: AAA family ATPase [Gemmatimonadales bacterium]|nr:AAA family ATPase [Gemmatimonadales bacterium]
MITVRVLGPVSLEVDGGPAPPELLWRKHLALLIYLARSPKRGRTREHLTGLLWPDREEGAARHSLNEALRVIRRAAGDAAIETAGGQVRLAGDAVHLDAEDLDRWVAEQAWERAAAIVTGEFLEGFAIGDSEGFEDWLAAERSYWRDHGVTALLGHSAALLQGGQAGEALTVARRALGLDPHSDQAVRAVMTAAAIQGDLSSAAACYEQFAARLGRDLGTVPADATRALLQRIRTIPGPRPPQRAEAEPQRRRAPLVGRRIELERLVSIWETSRRTPAAAAAIVEGDTGIGKSRMVEEFISRVRLGGGTVALSRAVEADLSEPGSGWLGLARGGLLDAPGLLAAPPQALATLASSLPEWAERFPAATREGTALALAPAITAVLDAVLSSGPLVLAVDDAHWLDRPSLLGLVAALRDFSQAPLCLVLSVLPSPAREELDSLRRGLGGTTAGAVLKLNPLDAAALREVAAWSLPSYDAVALERVCRRVASDSAGLPLLAVELLSAVAAGLDLHQGVPAWPAPFHTLTETLPGDLPDAVVAALRIGFRRLSPEAQRVLAAASVAGNERGGRITEALLTRATELGAPVVQAALDELEWQRWLESDGQGYGFVARLAREVVARDMLTRGQAARIRERLGS